ncbi:MAG: hypothetical protein JWM04_500 [Verrucomicrobiales bacterium]|nr:hypothetical protein [Verrucomicrobiales bacterium]
MSKQLKEIDSELASWIRLQHLFFVATAPLSALHHVNASPKGGDTFRILGPMEMIYQDYTGSGAETIAHLRENARITLMFCAFEGPPKIVRLYGTGSVILPGDALYDKSAALFPPNPGTRCFIHIVVQRVSSSCGYSVPYLDYRGPRDALDKWAEKQGPDKLEEYRASKNSKSIDGLPALADSSGDRQSLLNFVKS